MSAILSWLISVPRFIAAPVIYHLLGWLYDNPLWITVVGWLGNSYGNGIMSLVAFFINLTLLVSYVRNDGSDWLKINVIDQIKERLIYYGNLASSWEAKNSLVGSTINLVLFLPSKILQLLIKILNKGGDPIAFIALSFWADAFLCTVYLRHGDFSPLRKKDFLLFFSSLILSCLYWSARNSFIVEFAKNTWRLLTT